MGKEGVKRKWWVLAHPSYSQPGNGRQSPRVEPWNQGDRPPDAEKNPGSRYRQRLVGEARLWGHSRYIHIIQEQHERGPHHIWSGGRKSGFNSWGVRGPALVFCFYVNVSEMHPRSRLSSQLLTIQPPWVLLLVRGSIPVVPWFHPGDCLPFPCGE